MENNATSGPAVTLRQTIAVLRADAARRAARLPGTLPWGLVLKLQQRGAQAARLTARAGFAEVLADGEALRQQRVLADAGAVVRRLLGCSPQGDRAFCPDREPQTPCKPPAQGAGKAAGGV